MVVKYKINPIFPFEIQKIKKTDNITLQLTNDITIIKLIAVKSGSIKIDDLETKSKSIIYNTKKNIIINNNAEFYLIQFKNKLLDVFLSNTYEKNIFQELFNKEYKVFDLNENIFFDFIIILEKILTEFKNKKTGYHSIIRNKFIEFLITLYRNIENNNLKSTDERIKLIIDYIQNNYTEEISLQKLSELTASNPSYLSRIFKNKTGETIFEYVNRIRIEKACHLLKKSKMTVLDISIMAGYNNLSFFNRYFKKIMNLSPTEYRNLPY